jgi:hypothetical protein
MNNNNLDQENNIVDNTTLISVKDNFKNIISSDINSNLKEANSPVSAITPSIAINDNTDDLKSHKNIPKLIIPSLQSNEINIKMSKSLDKNRNYYKMIFCYFIFLLLGFFGGLFINIISNHQIINFDMLFNIIISPIVYYHSPRNILMNLDKIKLLKYYFTPFLFGLMFRFFDRIPGFSQFVLDPYYIKSTLQISLLSTVLFIILTLSIYYIYISSNPILNTILFLCEIVLTVISCYYYLLDNGYIHIHHYFIGLIIMLVSKNYHSQIVVIAHAISYAIYIEGISGYGFDSIFWKK